MTQFRSYAAVLLIVLVACNDATKPVDPATVASVSLTPERIALVKGSRESLQMSARDAAGGDVRIGAAWVSSAPSIATVSNDGKVTAVNYGAVDITATVGMHSATSHLVVTDVPVPRTYSVLDVGVVPGIDPLTKHFSDSGDVLARHSGQVYHNGRLVSMPGCGSPVTLNGPGHVLCTLEHDSLYKYAVWRSGTLMPLAALDTFHNKGFRAYTLNDSDVVAGLIYQPEFTNPDCPPSNTGRCLVLWKDGAPTFPGLMSFAYEEVFYLNTRQQSVRQSPVFSPSDPSATNAYIHDLTTKVSRPIPSYVRAINDAAWLAIEHKTFLRVSSSILTTAQVMTPRDTIVLGEGSATGINNSNVVVGTLLVGPFIWRGSGGVSLLSNAATDPTWTVTAADEINNRGQILATADNSDGRKGHTVILTPVQP